MTVHDTHTVEAGRIPEHIVPGKRLGRHIRHDSRNRRYAWQRKGPVALRDVLWDRHIPILNQGDAGSCTGESETGCLATEPVWTALNASQQAGLTQDFAYALYSAAETLDGDGPYPPNDNGSSGPSICQAALNLKMIAGYSHCFSVTDVLDALMNGPVILGTNWYDCPTPGSRVLTADLRWVPIEKIQVGDELVGFDEQLGHYARYRRSTVTATGAKPAEVYEIVTDQGVAAVSGGHMFARSATTGRLSGKIVKGRQHWARADQLAAGDTLAYFMAPYGEDTSWEAGWLAGFFDAEGTVSVTSNQVNVGQALGPTLDQAVRLMGAKGYEITVKQVRLPGTDGRGIVSRKPFANMLLRGGYAGALRFLGEIRPERLLAKASGLWEGNAIRSRCCPSAVVQEVRLAGRHEVCTIGMSTGTLVVEGFLSHNSFDTLAPGGQLIISPDAQVRGGHETLWRGYDTEGLLLLGDNSWGEEWGLQGSMKMPVATLERLLAEQGDCTVSIPLGQPVPVQPAA